MFPNKLRRSSTGFDEDKEDEKWHNKLQFEKHGAFVLATALKLAKESINTCIEKWVEEKE